MEEVAEDLTLLKTAQTYHTFAAHFADCGWRNGMACGLAIPLIEAPAFHSFVPSSLIFAQGLAIFQPLHNGIPSVGKFVEDFSGANIFREQLAAQLLEQLANRRLNSIIARERVAPILVQHAVPANERPELLHMNENRLPLEKERKERMLLRVARCRIKRRAKEFERWLRCDSEQRRMEERSSVAGVVFVDLSMEPGGVCHRALELIYVTP
mmetsp:Transcript_38194/g.95336  ORF Transcript_38194/g.95336 Transcript_38194/m.95336 type:complete len:211 (+) Transcript_38194:1944-2576(+)